MYREPGKLEIPQQKGADTQGVKFWEGISYDYCKDSSHHCLCLRHSTLPSSTLPHLCLGNLFSHSSSCHLNVLIPPTAPKMGHDRLQSIVILARVTDWFGDEQEHSKDNGKQRAICWGFWEKCTRSIFPGRFNGLMWGYEVWNGLQILPWEGQV